MDKIVYFACNDWNPTPKEADNICYNYLMSYSSVNKDIVYKTIEDCEEWMKDNKICINVDIVDMSSSYYITAPLNVFEKYFKELLSYVKEEPYDFMFIGDKKFFLEHKEENIGFNFIGFES